MLKKRMKSGVENPVENFPQGGEKTRDLVAKATGFGNGKTLGQYETAAVKKLCLTVKLQGKLSEYD